LGDPLFVDGNQLYRELLYKFIKYRERRYYQPTKELVEWLTMIDEFHEWKKSKIQNFFLKNPTL